MLFVVILLSLILAAKSVESVESVDQSNRRTAPDRAYRAGQGPHLEPDDTNRSWSRFTDVEKLTRDANLMADESQTHLGLVQSQGADPHALGGDPTNNQDVWQAHNPFDLASQLQGTRLFVSAGNGRPGPLDRRGATEDQIEAGAHNWVYWQRELHRAWPLIRRGLDL